MKTLKLECDRDAGEAAVMNWTVSVDTPDTVYYQVIAIIDHVNWYNRRANIVNLLLTQFSVLYPQQPWLENSCRQLRHKTRQRWCE